MQPVRNAIAGQVRQIFGSGGRQPPPPRDPGDDGLFGPGAVAWRVHGDLNAMMIGGLAALLLQMLHPAALAGVWDHSNFRRDMAGRLRRTAEFIAGTTFGPTAYAEALIDRVRRIHDRVNGVLPDGRAYSANDPAVLTWVHVTGAACFLDAFIRYREPWLSRREQDRYFAETAVIARRLGATEIPEDRAAVDTYLLSMRPSLGVDARTVEVTRIVLGWPAPNPMMIPLTRLMIDAGIDLLPRWAAAMHGLTVAPHRRPLVRAGGGGLGVMLRWALSGPPQPAR